MTSERPVRWLIEHLKGELWVLDVGCGDGIPTAKQLADAGCGVVGVDTSPAELNLARKNVPAGIFVERAPHDLGGLHPRQARFDGAVAFLSELNLDHTEMGKILDAIRNVLAAEGLFVTSKVDKDTLAHHGFTVLNLLTDSHLYACCVVTPVM